MEIFTFSICCVLKDLVGEHMMGTVLTVKFLMQTNARYTQVSLQLLAQVIDNHADFSI